MISNELLEEIISISLKGRFINKEILQRIFDELFVSLDDYTKQNFNRLELTEIFSLDHIIAICNPNEGIIIFDLYENYYVENKNKNKSMLCRNLNIIVNLLHEIEHLKQPYKIKIQSFESKLLKSSIAYFHKEYKRLYEYVPAEKIASANSWENLFYNVKLYPNFKENFYDEYKFVNNEYIKNLKLGYYFSESFETYNKPLFHYLSKIGQKEVLEYAEKYYIENQDILVLNDKLKYGLPITKNDMRMINKQKIKSKSII